jgi:hypothetical protein
MYRSTLVAAVLSLTACQDQFSPVAPGAFVPLLQTGAPTTKTNTSIALNYSFFSSCTGENLLVTGRLHLVSTGWNDYERWHFQSHMNVNLAGTGLTSGRIYRLLQITNQKYERTWATGEAVSDQVFVFNVISATETPNFYVTMNGTWRFSANGTVTIEPGKWDTVCR